MLINIAREIASKGGRAFYTGGYVRDCILYGDPGAGKDIDIEVFSLNRKQFLSILDNYGTVMEVGRSFPVIKIKNYPQWDFTMPEKEHITYQKACARRDFTINAMMKDILSGEILDFFEGKQDLQKGIIRHTSEKVFLDDPLRAYRAIQLAARFIFSIDSVTLELIKQCRLEEIKPERIMEEMRKLLLLSSHPSIGLKYMQEAGILKRRHPMLFNLVGCEQSPVNHPEGDVWEHTLQVVDIAATLKHKSANPEVLMFAALLHDLGKPVTTRKREGKITAYGHDVEGERMAKIFLNGLNASNNLIAGVCRLVREHMHPVLLYKTKEKVSDKAIRKLVTRVNVRELMLLAEADFKGRGWERDFEPIRNWISSRMESLGLNPEQEIKPLIQGRDLIGLGMEPGKYFHHILDMTYEMQLEGKSRAQIIDWVKKKMKNN